MSSIGQADTLFGNLQLEARAGGEEGVSGAKELLDDGHVAYLLKLSEASGYSNQAAHYESLGEKLTDGGRIYAEGLRKMAHEKKVEAWRAEAARLRNLGSALTDAGRKLAEKLEKQVDEADQQAKD
ncbi:hypothetical protein A4X06_0g1030 [Tilletia controversa]|uniref:Uncharacterized protein n=1 Tax=Tilletia controversa TaxID=13291 RepID=A0A8X7MZ09_9BASI|nr:hypothetical protein A4X06_0g1030 [Tilletia controversa]